MYVFDLSDEDVRSEQEGEAEYIRTMKRICFPLLLTSDNEQAVMSFVDLMDFTCNHRSTRTKNRP